MNYFLTLIILALGWGAYYEYGQMQKQNARDKSEFETTISAQMAHLQDDNTKLTAANAELTKNLASAQAKIAVLTNASPAPQNSAPVVPTPPPAAPKPPLPSNDLGSILTSDGKKFEKSHLLKVEDTGIVINSASGVTQLKFSVLPPGLQTRFGFDPQKGSSLTPAQVQTMEQQRILSEQGASAGP